MTLSTNYDLTPCTMESMTRVRTIIEIQRMTSNVTSTTFKSDDHVNVMALAMTLRSNLLEALKIIESGITVKVEVVDTHRLLVKVDAGKTGKVTLKVKRKPGGIWSRNFD